MFCELCLMSIPEARQAMAPSPDPAKQLLQDLISTGLKLQWRSVKAQWEPALTRALGQTADDCLALLRQELAALAASPDARPA